MDSQLKARMETVRRALAAHEEPAPGFLAPPAEHLSFPKEVPPGYQEFLRLADGAVCGVVILYESDELLRKQGPAKELPGGRQRWFCIGDVDNKPLIMDNRINAVHLIDPEEKFDPDESLGDVEYFLLTYVFGDNYSEFVYDPADDPWYMLLQGLHITQALPERDL